MQVLPVQNTENPSIPHYLLNSAPRPSNGPVPPGLLQLPASWPPGIYHQTPTTDPECRGTPDIQRSQIYAHHPPAHWTPLAACYSSHQIQDIGACIPGSQGISPRLHPTAHQTRHTCQTSTLGYLWTSGTPAPVTPAHLVHDCCLFWSHDGGMTVMPELALGWTCGQTQASKTNMRKKDSPRAFNDKITKQRISGTGNKTKRKPKSRCYGSSRSHAPWSSPQHENHSISRSCSSSRSINQLQLQLIHSPTRTLFTDPW